MRKSLGSSAMGHMRTLLISLASFSAAPLFAQVPQTGFLDRVVTVQRTAYRYQVYLPSSYQADRAWPVILFLHGAGARGTDGVRPTDQGLGSAIRRNPERWPAIVVFPQVPPDSSWLGQPGAAALAALTETMREFRTDSLRVYLTGQSMGGQGSWYLAYEHPQKFAAVVIICGFIGPLEAAGTLFRPFLAGDSTTRPSLLAERVKGLSLWIYHGDADSTVPVINARDIDRNLQRLQASSRYTEIKGGGHNLWDTAYRSEELPLWLFQQRRR